MSSSLLFRMGNTKQNQPKIAQREKSRRTMEQEEHGALQRLVVSLLSFFLFFSVLQHIPRENDRPVIF